MQDFNGIIAEVIHKIDYYADRHIWISHYSKEDLLLQAHDLEQRVAAGEQLPLVGTVCAVKDNIDVAGLPTTAACPSYSYLPTVDAPAVAALRNAGAIIVGKTNLDQFATGLVGTRSPYGAVGSAHDPNLISGGSSSGSAVAVALGIVDFALGTDTAGSGRVPAALNGIYGIKPTRGLVSTTGVVPACRSLDCVTVFARTITLARTALTVMIDYDPNDPYSRPYTIPRWDTFGMNCPMPTSGEKTIAIPLAEQLTGLAPGWEAAFYAYVQRVRASGHRIEERDISPLLEAATLLYGPCFVAERYAAVGNFIQQHRDQIGNQIDPHVAAIILGGKTASAAELFAEQTRLRTLISLGQRNLSGVHALLTPTTTAHPSIAQINNDPISGNSALGKYTNFCNLADCATIAVPAGTVNGQPFGVMYTGVAFTDYQLVSIAESIIDPEIAVFVVGAHRKGQVLNHELIRLGAKYLTTIDTAACYELYSLDTVPPKPGLVYCNEGVDHGIEGVDHGIEGELWSLTPDRFAQFVGQIPAPMTIGTIKLSDGREVKGFLCEPYALADAVNITKFRSWLSWIARRS